MPKHEDNEPRKRARGRLPQLNKRTHLLNRNRKSEFVDRVAVIEESAAISRAEARLRYGT